MTDRERVESAVAYVKDNPNLFARVATIHPNDITDRVGTIPGPAYQFALRLNCRFFKGFTPDELRTIIKEAKL